MTAMLFRTWSSVCWLPLLAGALCANPADRAHEPENLRAARAANRAHPDNLDTYAELACILRSLGRRAEAVETVQWMLNLRPTDPRGLWLAALLREDTGDLEGASDLMAECFQRTPAGLTAKRAEYLLGLARVFKKQGKRQEAEQLLREAQRLIPTQEKP